MRRLAAALGLAALALLPAAAKPAVSVPVDVQDGHVYVQVRLPHGKPLWFLIDSGAATPVDLLAQAAATQLGIKGEGRVAAGAIGGNVNLTFTPPLRLTIGGVPLAREQLGIIPLGGGAPGEHPVDGLLGYNFFKTLNPQIDYPHGRMRLRAMPGLVPGSVPLRILGKSIQIGATLVLGTGQQPVPVRLIVDTGYDGGLLLTSPFVRAHGELLKAAGPATSGASVGGTTTRRHLTLPSLAIGATTVGGIDAMLSTDSEGAFATGDADGYIGGAFLKAYVVSFDYRHGRFTLRAP